MNKSLVCSNVKLKKNTAYLMYFGSFKYHEITEFFLKPLKKYYKKPVEIIYVFPNYPSPYFKGNYVVLNPKVKRSGKRCYIPMNSSSFNRLVSSSDYVRSLIKKILKNQKDLFMQLFKDSPEFTLHRDFPNIRLLGPSVRTFAKYDSKLFQHELCDTLGIPQPRWFLVHNKEDLIKTYKRYWNNKKAFVTKVHSLGGGGCAVVDSVNAIKNHRHLKNKNCRYIIEDYVPFRYSPTTSAIVANEKEIFFNTVMGQFLYGPVNLGTIYPPLVDKKIQKKCEEYTLKIGKYLGRYGFKGFISLDFVVDRKGNVYFSEVNPRIGGSTLEKVFMHEMTKPEGFPSLPELEFRAITKGTFGVKQKKIKKPGFSWAVRSVGTYKSQVLFDKDIFPECDELTAFKKFKTVVLDFPGKGVFIDKGSHVCRVVSVKRTRKEVEKEIKQKVRQVKSMLNIK